MQAGMTLVKYILFIFNLLFVVVGIVLTAVGGWVQGGVLKYRQFLTHDISAGPALLIAVGVFIMVLAFLGCCGAIKENHCMTMTYAVLLTIIVIIEIAGTISAIMFSKKFEKYVRDGMNQTLYDYPKSDDYAKLWNVTQHDLKCCGVDGPEDWHNATLPIPSQCCKDELNCTIESQNLYTTGCLKKLEKILGDQVYTIGAIGLAFTFLEVLGIIFACCMARYIRHQYEVV